MKGTGAARACLGWGLIAALVFGESAADAQVAKEAWPPAEFEYEKLPESAPRVPTGAWYERMAVKAFVDGYARVDFLAPKSPGESPLFPYRGERGLAFSWVGLDVSQPPEPIGGALSLRAGPTARDYAGADADLGLEYVKQAYATLQPAAWLRFDLGKFDSPFGLERAESQYNVAYSPGLLHALALPRFHTGVRVALITAYLTLRGFVVNGWDRTLDNNFGKSYGGQLEIKADKPHLSEYWWVFRIGALVGPEQPDQLAIDCPADTRFVDGQGCEASPGSSGAHLVLDRGDANDIENWRTLVAASFDSLPDRQRRWRVGLDFALVRDRQRPNALASSFESRRYWGVGGAVSYEFDPLFRPGLRIEYLRDVDAGSRLGESAEIGSLSAVFDSMPAGDDPRTMRRGGIPYRPLLFRLEVRGDLASREILPEGLRDTTRYGLSSTLAVVGATR
jgi:hypothetical protein